MADRPELSITEAAKACRVSRRTISRRLSAGDLDGAHRNDAGAWLIPIEALISAGLSPNAPSPPDPPTADRFDVDRLRDEVADWRRRCEVAEARADERDRTIDALRAHVRALEAGPRPPVEGDGPTPPEPERRGLWRRWRGR